MKQDWTLDETLKIIFDAILKLQNQVAYMEVEISDLKKTILTIGKKSR